MFDYKTYNNNNNNNNNIIIILESSNKFDSLNLLLKQTKCLYCETFLGFLWLVN